MVSKYSVEVMEEPQFIGETFEERNMYTITSPFCLPVLAFSFSPVCVGWYSRDDSYLNRNVERKKV